MKEDVLFKRTPFGGFDRVEVISYIQQLKTTQQKYKLMLDEKDTANAKLTRDIEDLRLQVEGLRKITEQYEKEIAEADAQVKSLRAKNEILEKKMNESADENEEYVSETVKMCDELVETASETAKKIVSAAENKLSNAQKQINDAVAELESKEKVTAKQAKDLLAKLVEGLK